MASTSILPIPDETKEPWVFLILSTQHTPETYWIDGWQFGTGNHLRLVRASGRLIDDPANETEILDALYQQLQEYRYQGVTITTPTAMTMARLRTRLWDQESIPDPTFRGFDHLTLIELLDGYFDQWRTLREVPDLVKKHEIQTDCLPAEAWGDHREEYKAVEIYWDLRRAIAPLVPPRVLTGTPI